MFKEIVASMITPAEPRPFDLETHILEQKLIKAQANTDKVINEMILKR